MRKTSPTFYIGLIIILIGITLMWFNELNIVKDRVSILEIKKKLVSIDINNLTPANNNKPVYFNTIINSKKTISDQETINLGPWLKITRISEMFQWQEKRRSVKKKLTVGSVSEISTYVYDHNLAWSPGRIKSGKFQIRSKKYNNPEIENHIFSFQQEDISIGTFNGDTVIEHIPIKEMTEENNFKSIVSSNYLIENKIYSKKEIFEQPKLGDLRFSYYFALPGIYTVIAKQLNRTTLAPYSTHLDQNHFIVKKGNISIDEMLKIPKANLNEKNSKIRIILICLIFFGALLTVSQININNKIYFNMISEHWIKVLLTSIVLSAISSVGTIANAYWYYYWEYEALIIGITLLGIISLSLTQSNEE